MRDKILKHACSGMFSDELDKTGYRNQIIQGLAVNSPKGKIYGRARTIKIQTMKTDDENIRTGLGFIGRLQRGDVLCVEGSQQFAYFGELMTRLSVRQGLGGVVIGGLTRDSLYTQTEEKLTIFAAGYSPKDIKGRGRVEATDVVVTIGGIQIRKDDWIFGDRDGVVVIPFECLQQVESKIVSSIGNEEKIISDIKKNLTVEEILNRYKEF